MSYKKICTHRIAAACVGSRVVLAYLALTGCDASSAVSDIPAISQPVPALPVDVMSPSDATLSLSDPFLTGLNSLPQTVEPASLTADNSTCVDSATTSVSGALSAQATTLLQQAAARGGMRIMAVGDTVTQVDGAGYPIALARLLRATDCPFHMVGSLQSADDSSVRHEGYPGHTASHFLTGHESTSGNNAGIADAVSFQAPDLVILTLGATDLTSGRSVESTLADIASVVDTIFEYKPETAVVVAIGFPEVSGSSTERDESARQLADQLHRYVQAVGNPLLSSVDISTFDNSHIADTLFNSLFSPSLCR